MRPRTRWTFLAAILSRAQDDVEAVGRRLKVHPLAFWLLLLIAFLGVFGYGLLSFLGLSLAQVLLIAFVLLVAVLGESAYRTWQDLDVERGLIVSSSGAAESWSAPEGTFERVLVKFSKANARDHELSIPDERVLSLMLRGLNGRSEMTSLKKPRFGSRSGMDSAVTQLR